MSIKEKLTSRKFWLCVASFLASFGAGISGLVTSNEGLAVAGTILCAVSAGIYAACEAYVDASATGGDTDEAE